MKKITGLFLALFALQCVFAQTLSPIVKQHHGFNYQRLAQIDTILKNYQDQNWLVGAVVIIVKDNQVVYYKGSGYANRSSKTKMQADAIFRIMSQTKAITSLAIMQLLEQGRLTLDQPISDFIPEFKKPKLINSYNASDTSYTTIAAKREITFRDLLTHTSGIGYPASGSDTMRAIYAKNNIPSGLGYFKGNALAKMKAVAALPLKHNPGSKYTYGLSTDVLGCLVEIISGESLETYFHKNIFEPLGMKDTYFNVPATKAGRIPTVYTEDENNYIIEWSPTFRNIDPGYPLFQKNTFSGGSGLSSTAFDYSIFLQMLLNGGRYNNKQILGRRTVELMLSPQLADNVFGDNNFCLGFEYTTEKTANLKMQNKGSFSWGGFYGSYYWADPKEKLICLIMTQHTPNSHKDFVDKITNTIYGSLK
ncbi:serine hydrolase domain-containing protein [Lacibacter sediminis]|uniref:Beta-lactamase family protein n=1 Tax=Lacibacter sediminis TaxID=2760713 RepID=A0A7G5XDB3_9BACT|nr:serine hydrolase domain-containing protein [Lacibacter sediminis]QNA43466.1 beta-lactamase family protein [Lacibacter sediminis]